MSKYANPAINEGKVTRLMEMGFTKEQANNALLKHGFDEEKALEELLQ